MRKPRSRRPLPGLSHQKARSKGFRYAFAISFTRFAHGAATNGQSTQKPSIVIREADRAMGEGSSPKRRYSARSPSRQVSRRPAPTCATVGTHAPVAGPHCTTPRRASRCNGGGYRGRIGLFEVMELTRRVRRAITNGRSELEILDLAREERIRTLREAAHHHGPGQLHDALRSHRRDHALTHPRMTFTYEATPEAPFVPGNDEMPGGSGYERGAADGTHPIRRSFVVHAGYAGVRARTAVRTAPCARG